MKVDIKDIATADGMVLNSVLKELSDLEVRVGFQQEESNEEQENDKKEKGNKKKASICDYALYNEIGVPSKNIPSRPFLRKSVDENGDKIDECLDKISGAVLRGLSARRALDMIGNFQVGLIQKKIIDGEYEPNKEATIKRKKSSRPLIDTGRMRQSVKYVIKKKGQD